MVYKVLIADDEMLARYSLKTLISKNFNNISIVGEAENGRQAIEKAKILNPHIIFMDIKMPGINGLDASEEILNANPEVIIIILSAHDNFSYAQRALNDGVHSYLLKPFQKQEIVDKLTDKISYLDNLEKKRPVQNDLLPFLEEELIAFLIGDNADVTIEKQIQSILNFEIDSGLFLLITCPEIKKEDKTLAIQLLNKKVKCLSSQRTGVDLAFFISGASFNNQIEKLKPLIHEYISQLKRLIKLDVKCGVGDLMMKKKDLEQSFHQAFISLKNINNDKDIIFYSEHKVLSKGSTEKYPAELESKLLEKIQGRDFQGIEDLIGEIINNISGISDMNTLKEFAGEFLNALIRTAKSMGLIDIKGISPFPLLELFKLQTANEIRHYLKSTALQIRKDLQLEEGDSNWWLERAFLYLKKNLYTDISLDIIADKINISPQHLSRIFKSKYGKTIGEYIVDQRMSYAKYLLTNSDYSIKDITDKIGYTDQNYFSRVFKKHTGSTPSQYKELT